ncbi:MAG: ATP-binding cassette domain-containing protein [Paludibacteraceae bacterium]|jgi:ABC-2 type transport system ATP-binding protein|nr:ATP-binding cassette domain-containing protein [Paludibacteraceae bacterium]MBP9016315.1 ATP-binding cassette domain-containing protein [Paludibacteraceae bacterium]HNZ62363.1 ABC transporter ATP-binding protein [Paludibacteraceae bacterium]
MPFLEVKNVVKQYAEHLALNDVSMDVPENTIYGLLGPNGAGKTTLIRIINSMTAPDSGTILLKGKPLTFEDVRHIGYLPEERGLYKKMKVGEQALYLAQLKGMSRHDALKALKYWFQKFEIQSWWNKKVEELSKGMAQKVQFVITILHEPKLLIFDEPFSGFDPVNTDLLKQEIIHLKEKGATIIFSTHNMASVEELCENISLIHQSKIVLQGNVAEIRASFSTKTFKVITREPISNGIHFELVQQVRKNDCVESIIKKVNACNNNTLLSEILQQTEILAFEELLPSMNDIFIETVSGNSKNPISN